MKALIIYFSQTGNTLTLARQIQEGILEHFEQCDLVRLDECRTDEMAETFMEYDLVGLGSPVFYYREPFHVRDFLESLPDLQNKPWFVFCTHGSVIGNFFPSVAQCLAQKGAAIVGYHHAYAGISVPYYPDPTYTSGHPDEEDLDQARRFGIRVAESITRGALPDPGSLPAPGPVSSDEWIEDADRLTWDFLKKIMPRLRLDKGLCSGCQTCMEECPVQGIDIEAAPPRLQSPCIFCWRCVNVCPTGAMNADWDKLVAIAPEQYARYKKELDKCAEQGQFRWLIDPDDVDCSKPLYKQREKA